MSSTWVRVCYGILLGGVLALAAGFGTAIFVSEPRPPQSPGLSFSTLSGNSTDQETARIAKQIDGFFDDAQTFRTHYPDYQRNVFVCFAAIGIVLGIIGVALPAVVNYLRLGFLIGGGILIAVGTWFAVQSVPAGAPDASNVLSLLSFGTPKVIDTAGRFVRFAVSIVGVLLLLFVALWRLTEWSAPTAATARVAAPPVPQPTGRATPAAAEPAPPAPQVVAPDALKWARPEERPAIEGDSGAANIRIAEPTAVAEPPAAPTPPAEGHTPA